MKLVKSIIYFLFYEFKITISLLISYNHHNDIQIIKNIKHRLTQLNHNKCFSDDET